MISNTRFARVDPELQPFVSMFPRAELNDPITRARNVLSPEVSQRQIAELGTVLHHALSG